MKGIYAIYDTVADDILGPPQLFAHQAAAIRFFGDVASMPDSQVGKHIDDFCLVRLGWYEVKGGQPSVDGDYELIMHGSTWAAAQNNTPVLKEA